jgi:hypothetical protein
MKIEINQENAYNAFMICCIVILLIYASLEMMWKTDSLSNIGCGWQIPCAKIKCNDTEALYKHLDNRSFCTLDEGTFHCQCFVNVSNGSI